MLKIDRKLNRIESSVIAMGEAVISQHQRCERLLASYDQALAHQIIDLDKEINDYEVNINEQAVADIVLLRPVAGDLRRVLVAIKIASDLERIGDYAKGMANYILKYDEEEGFKTLMNHAIVMEKKLVAMLIEIIESYRNKDADAAFIAAKHDKELNKLLKEFRHKLLQEEAVNLNHVFHLSSLFRNIERAGDHSVNICEHIVYLDKGVLYDFDSEEN